ncbi:MAG: ATP-binding cassette domain-containing protein [bacterium]|jgi:phospholipid/cholesterol/gamma-HCH transport system ATP-binding protein|nr:ATP-binding cassette domain-containing protein [Planctomycetota bacterium]HIL51897.1 ATP-binding cassette domain-containing protein [Planctomycetota bacterium]
MTLSAICIRDLSVGYGGLAILDGLNFEIRRGSIFAILGGSGCGKTTLLENLIGIQEPLAGEIDITGFGTPDLDRGFPPYGVSFQGGALFGSMTLLENVSLPLVRWTTLAESAIEAVASARLRLVGLAGFENHLPNEVSGGMQKRAGIARALAMEPSLLFLDEPSAGLDPSTAVELDDLLCCLRDDLGVTTVLVTHELASIFSIADDCIMLDKQARGIIARGSPTSLRDESQDPTAHAFFNRLPKTPPQPGVSENCL